MAGIYIHIPFCKQQCTYCDFHFSTTFEVYRTQMVNAIAIELEIRADDWRDQRISTIYFGGGTPSLLTSTELNLLLNSCRKHYSLEEELEITLECNPDDCALESLNEWKLSGINRLSIGLQALQNEQLTWMNRTHSSLEGLDAIHRAITVGFDNITVDLMYGLPDLSNAEWQANVIAVASLPIQHISAYCLTIEAKTPLAAWIKNGKLKESSNQTQSEQFMILVETLNAYGFEQYEISNFAKDNRYSKHNTNYWMSVPYIAVGPSAHGFNGNERYWNIANNQLYMKALEHGELPQEVEELSIIDKFNEYLMVGLRTKWGVDFRELTELWPVDSNWIKLKDQFIEAGEMIETETHLILTVHGRLRADAITSDLFN